MEYRLNCGQYVLHAKRPLSDDLEPVLRPLDQISLAIDTAEGTLHKHGAPERVAAWYADTSRKLREGGCGEWADNLVVVTGRFPIDEVNKCVGAMSYAGIFYKRLVAGEIEEMPFISPSAEEADERDRPGGG
ncbi:MULTISPECIES: hypothetical protein [unclassified Variovorax]|uniref:hypothetical protein n=1 Tax=unclassified Variovorax TaxID=663243 RepID=UPI00076DDC74|nr:MULTISPECIES: hypothetical protein [unclassified Variovorax]KWT69571.1 hypothetical protein APY03_6931 [Variovorax sp. WDL1]PNG48890.1 hypothetical protein CHC06_06658 [Variovorax sp. B2]PNG49397.1 hypothetical protein CHC07_06306 [Variovorax sp. B4]VTV18299.1 hypothetical protein WDL1P2_00018 [Variovorax sp. WDL1]